ncbi:MAG: crotonobetainyl-CoA:carnitine CoA-transferase CaiB-like acyl-CoA transferase [Rhodoferax sp.]|jgi:crotonobetainyl-CoA:carnitine CoA-transferase CaiB-like acyl-CoA transferase
MTYLAENGLITGLNLPATLYADMGGSLKASEAVLLAVLAQKPKSLGHYLEVALSGTAAYLTWPRSWGLTRPGAAVGEGHAGYRVYAFKHGRVAVAALEPQFARSLCNAVGMQDDSSASLASAATQTQIANVLLSQARQGLEQMALAQVASAISRAYGLGALQV